MYGDLGQRVAEYGEIADRVVAVSTTCRLNEDCKANTSFECVRENADIPKGVVLRVLDGQHRRVQIVAGARTYGQVITGLARPAAEISRSASAHDIFGTAVLVASTDHEELVRLCHRVLILRRGRIADEVSGGRMDHDLITAATIGRDQADAT